MTTQARRRRERFAGTGAAVHLDRRVDGIPHVAATGPVDDARLDALLRGVAALVHPSPYEELL